MVLIMLILAYDDFSYLTPLMGVLLHNEYNKLTRYTDAWKYKHISYLFLSHYFVLKEFVQRYMHHYIDVVWVPQFFYSIRLARLK